MFLNSFLLFLLPAFFFGCSGLEQSEQEKIGKQNLTIDYLPLKEEAELFSHPFPSHHERSPYPWEKRMIGSVRRITKEFFRCNGHPLHPPIKILQGDNHLSYHLDCGGGEQHSLPLRDGKEFIYPILIELLNWIQEKTGKKVMITSGHRCPLHQLYTDPAKRGSPSKHMIGALVTFYVEGMEHTPDKIASLLGEYFQTKETYLNKPEYLHFARNGVSSLVIPSWNNKEVLIKVYKETEGRDFDNQHRYPYLSIEVLYDKEKEKKVLFSWHEASSGYLHN